MTLAFLLWGLCHQGHLLDAVQLPFFTLTTCRSFQIWLTLGWSLKQHWMLLAGMCSESTPALVLNQSKQAGKNLISQSSSALTIYLMLEEIRRATIILIQISSCYIQHMLSSLVVQTTAPSASILSDGAFQYCRILLEKGYSEDTAEELRKKGHKVTSGVAGPRHCIFGRGQIIRRDAVSGVLWGGSDPRGDGQVLTWWSNFMITAECRFSKAWLPTHASILVHVWECFKYSSRPRH